MYPRAKDQIQVARSVLGLETSQKTAQSLLLWTVSSLELPGMSKPTFPPQPTHKAQRHHRCCTMFLYENTASGRDGPFLSGAGSSCRDQTGASGVSASQPPGAHPTPWHGSSSHRRSRMAPVPARLQAAPGLAPRSQAGGQSFASTVGTMPALGLGRDLHIGVGGQRGPYQDLLEILLTSFPSYASFTKVSLLGGSSSSSSSSSSGSLSRWYKVSTRVEAVLEVLGGKKATLRMAQPSPRNGTDPRVLPQPPVTAHRGDLSFPHSPGVPQDTMLSLGRDTLSLSIPSWTCPSPAAELTSSACPASACRPGPPRQQQRAAGARPPPGR